MPISRVPVVQNFGIIPHSCQLKLHRQTMEQNVPCVKINMWRLYFLKL